MTGPIKKAATQRDLDALAFSVLASFHQHGSAMQWRDWFQTTRTRRGKLGLGTGTFSETVKRLVAAERVQVDGSGCYQVVLNAAGDDVANTGIYQRADKSQNSQVTDVPNETDRRLTSAASATPETRPSAGVFLEAFREAEAENEKLRAENKQLLDWIMGESDALTRLQAIYQNSESSDLTRIRAATGAIGYERPKLTASIGVVMDFRERVQQARLKSTAKLLEHMPAATEGAADGAKAMKAVNPPKTIDHEA